MWLETKNVRQLPHEIWTKYVNLSQKAIHKERVLNNQGESNQNLLCVCVKIQTIMCTAVGTHCSAFFFHTAVPDIMFCLLFIFCFFTYMHSLLFFPLFFLLLCSHASFTLTYLLMCPFTLLQKYMSQFLMHIFINLFHKQLSHHINRIYFYFLLSTWGQKVKVYRTIQALRNLYIKIQHLLCEYFAITNWHVHVYHGAFVH